MNDIRQNLLIQAEAFCSKQGISLARLATIVVNNGSFFTRLKQGYDCNTASVDAFYQVFASDEAWRDAKDVERRRRSSHRAEVLGQTDPSRPVS